jgi:HEPN domain-containing protein
MTPALEEAFRLLRLARRDHTTLMLLARIPEAPVASLGFHAQQAVEKALKAVSVSRGLEARRTHDLAALATMLFDVIEGAPFTLDEIRQLNPFAVEYRYDDEFDSDLSRDQVSELVERVLAWVESCFTSSAARRT